MVYSRKICRKYTSIFWTFSYWPQAKTHWNESKDRDEITREESLRETFKKNPHLTLCFPPTGDEQRDLMKKSRLDQTASGLKLVRKMLNTKSACNAAHQL